MTNEISEHENANIMADLHRDRVNRAAQRLSGAQAQEEEARLEAEVARHRALRAASVVGEYRLRKQTPPPEVLAAQEEADHELLMARQRRDEAAKAVREAEAAVRDADYSVRFAEYDMLEAEDALLGITTYTPGRGRGRSGPPCAHAHCGRFPDQHKPDARDRLVCPRRRRTTH